MISKQAKNAIAFALEKHANQVDKAGQPYFLHVLRVALSVAPLGENYFIAAILHDVVEDCGVELSYIAEEWGQEIAEAVDSVSRREKPIKETYMSLIHRASLNVIGREVKLADIEDNSSPERIFYLPLEMQGIIKRYEKAKKYLLDSKVVS